MGLTCCGRFLVGKPIQCCSARAAPGAQVGLEDERFEEESSRLTLIVCILLISLHVLVFRKYVFRPPTG